MNEFVHLLLGSLPFGVVAIPTLLLALWPRAQRFAHIPLAAVLTMSGGLISFQATSSARPRSSPIDIDVAIRLLFRSLA